MAGSDGGVCASYDGGKTCDHLTNLPLGEVYALTVDMEDPYNIYAGLQDHESWKGPSNGWSGSVGLADWVTVGTGDGMYNQVDPTDSRWVYNTQEFGRPGRYDQQTRTREVDRAHQTCRPTDVAIQLGGADSLVAARSQNALCRSAGVVALRAIAAITGKRSARTSRLTTRARSVRPELRFNTARSSPSLSLRSPPDSSGLGRMMARCK